MKKQCFFLILVLTGLCIVNNAPAQISNYFNSDLDLMGWSAAHGAELYLSGGKAELVAPDEKPEPDWSSYWFTGLLYAPAQGVEWDFGKYRVMCVKVDSKPAQVAGAEFKTYDGASDYNIKQTNDNDAIPVGDDGALIYIFELDRLGFDGIKSLSNIQINFENVDLNDKFVFDWIETFENIADAYAFIARVLDGEEPPFTSGTDRIAAGDAITVYGGPDFVSFGNMKAETPVYIYDLSGRCIKESVAFNNRIPLDKGIYLVRLKNKTTKVAVR